MDTQDQKEKLIEVVSHSKVNTLYSIPFENGRFFQVVHEDQNSQLVKIAPRTMFKIVYIKENNDIEAIELIKLVSANEVERVKLNP